MQTRRVMWFVYGYKGEPSHREEERDGIRQHVERIRLNPAESGAGDDV